MSLEHNLIPYTKAGLFNGNQVEQSLDPCGSPLFHGWQFGRRATAATFRAQLPIPTTVNAGDTVTVAGRAFTARATPSAADEFSTSNAAQTLAAAINGSLTLAPDYQAFSGLAAAVTPVNLMASGDNGTFEANATGWSAPASGSGRTNAQAQAGTWSYRLSASVPSVGVTTNADVPLDAGRRYRVVFWARTDNRGEYTSGGLTFSVLGAGPLSAPANFISQVPANNAWSRVEYEFNQVSAGTQITFIVDGRGSSPAVWIDSVEVREVVASAGSGDVVVFGRRSGSALNLLAGSTIKGSFVSSPTFNTLITITNGTDADNAQQQIDWRAYVELWRADVPWGQPDTGAHNKLLGTFELPYVGSSEGYRVDIARYLQPLVSIPTPVRPYTSTLQQIGGFVGYRLKCGESYRASASATAAQVRSLVDYGVRWAAPHAVPLAIDPGNNLDRWADTPRSVWHEWPQNRIVRADGVNMPVYFWLAVQTSTAQLVSALFTFIMADGTIQAVTRALGSITASGLYELELSESGSPYNQLVGEWLRCTATISVASVNQVSFTLQKDASRDGRRFNTLLWRNRYGTFDLFTFDGSREEAIDLDRVEFGRATLPQASAGYYATVDPPDRIGVAESGRLVTTARRRLGLNSGLVDTAHHEWLLSLLLAKEVYLADTVDGIAGPQDVWRACSIVDQDWARDTEANLFNLSLTVEYGYEEGVLR